MCQTPFVTIGTRGDGSRRSPGRRKRNSDVTETLISSETQIPTLRATGPLAGIRVVEFAGLGPGPFASMMLADMGADVVTLTRGEQTQGLRGVIMMPGRREIACDLKEKACVADLLPLPDRADFLHGAYA